jgi:predicted RNA-binding protein associated with RNAse of E/G family
MFTRLEPTTDKCDSRVATLLPSDKRFPSRYAGEIHPPKRETFDVAARTNTDPKGIVRDVDVYAVHPWGLYMARPAPGRAQFHYLESWLLPSLGLRATIFHFNPGYERDQDFYLDVAQITVDGQVWQTEDHYLDLVVRTGSGVELIDVDELFEAVKEDLVRPETANAAVQTAVAAIDGLARHGYDLGQWLADHEMVLTWRAA